MPSEVEMEESYKNLVSMLQRSDAIENSDNSIYSGSSSIPPSSQSLQSSARNSTISGKHYDSLLGELRCPGCAKPMAPPIYLCESGHSVCHICCAILEDCPLCKQEFTKTRSVTLEAIASKAHFNCPNTVRGCTIRIPLELMKWHRSRCLFQRGDCFMGKVWGDCNWSGCEINWMNHCLEKHTDKVFLTHNAEIKWKSNNLRNSVKPVQGYFIFKAYGETFNLYHIHNQTKSRIVWTLICASREPKINQKFAYEIEIFMPNDFTRLMVYRNACHAENDQDILEEGRCISFPISDVLRLVDADKVLHYRFKVIELNYLCEDINTERNQVNTNCAKCITDYNVTDIANTNLKNIPSEHIIKRTEFENRRSLLNDKRNNFLTYPRLKPLNSIDIEISKDDALNKLMHKEFTIDKMTNEIIEKEPPSMRANSIPKPPRQSELMTSSPTQEEIELELFLDKRSVSQPPSLPNSPQPIQKVVCTESFIEVTRASIHDINKM